MKGPDNTPASFLLSEATEKPFILGRFPLFSLALLQFIALIIYTCLWGFPNSIMPLSLLPVQHALQSYKTSDRESQGILEIQKCE